MFHRALTWSDVKFIHSLSLLLLILSVGIVALRHVVLLDRLLIDVDLHALDGLLDVDLAVVLVLALLDAVGLAQSGVLHAPVQACVLGVCVIAVAVLANLLALVLDGGHLRLEVGIDEVG